ncbi:dTDP-4-dehydrorhamnose 3,5-epimerase [Anaerosolibacter carboniphilus]|uniref:dTDP-4-dehydrorhamnose 3,5-epimerase n=1 Tax=Anaerosolibacter carboniphilus TaxID=1417629 RepID=A0A841KQM2_9FIRM|nr:dTDP-4-dehydrorhamnose 3,5-epimerase [Anaerosolibacter carboniphilus]MBB6215727.1 dTDP-4-dehydrorhamnose 3,5-epimerase [Anaerosolibacter carboniphilus]
MNKFQFTKTPIAGLYVIEPKVFQDERGYFMETYSHKEFAEAGLNTIFVQDNQSKSKKGVLRGLHFQKKYPQDKLVRVLKGEVFDVAVDLRKDSATFGQWYGCVLSEKNKKQLYIPKGFAHGFLVLSDEAEFIYKCTDFYHPEDQSGIIWNDADIDIHWPLDHIDEVILSDKDKNWLSFNEYQRMQEQYLAEHSFKYNKEKTGENMCRNR